MADVKITEGKVPFKGFETWYQRVAPAGGADAGKTPLLTFHGGPGCLHNYLKSLDELAEKYGREVIYYDQLGCGNSPGGDADLWDTTLWVEEVDVMREALGLDQVHLLGQSWGGMLAMQYALTQPKGVKSMVVASSPASIPLWVEEANRLLGYMPPDQKAAIEKGIADEVYDSPEYLEASDEFYRRHVVALDPMPDYVAYSFDNMGEVYITMQGYNEFMVIGKLADWDITDRLGEITIPTLLTSGHADEATPLIVKEIYDRIPGARWELLRGTHLVHVEQKEVFNRIVEDFFEEHDAD
ncbi:MAG: proline iminopeptidase-family hydrolase [Actinomycetes bacterium]|jgi:proline-specific peptidase|nr:proline iminopeptidase-family hydrolase [Actinomycetes bacterium]